MALRARDHGVAGLDVGAGGEPDAIGAAHRDDVADGEHDAPDLRARRAGAASASTSVDDDAGGGGRGGQRSVDRGVPSLLEVVAQLDRDQVARVVVELEVRVVALVLVFEARAPVAREKVERAERGDVVVVVARGVDERVSPL